MISGKGLFKISGQPGLQMAKSYKAAYVVLLKEINGEATIIPLMNCINFL
jgi:hypothetical protein